MSKWHPRPKGQQKVNPSYKHKDNSIERKKYLDERRKYRYKTKDTVYGRRINCAKKLWEFLVGDLRYKDTYNNVLTQAERNLIKMYPCGGSWSLGGTCYFASEWYSIEGNSFILEKRNKGRHSYFNEDEWKDMIEFIRDATLRRGASVHEIIFCRKKLTDKNWEYNYNYYKEHYNDPDFNCKKFDKIFFDGFNREQLERMYYPKLYEKEKQFIINAGCEFIGDVEFDITKKPEYNGDTEHIYTMQGWKFRIIMDREPYKQEDNYIVKRTKRGNIIQKIKNMCTI